MKKILTIAIITISLLTTLSAENLDKNFKSPPPSARPHTWWHWINGNITKQGITADLEAMAQVGIGGAQIFNVGGQIVNLPQGPVEYMSPQWLEMVKHAATEADRLGIELCLHNCAGWTSTGGPWITPEYSMQVFVYKEIQTTGPANFSQQLPQPQTNMNYYRDIAILAYPTPKNDTFRITDPTLKSAGLIFVDYHHAKKYSLDPNFIPAPADAAISLDSIIDLTSKTDPAGNLDWNVPAGNWTILRIGYTTTGRHNHPAPQGGHGLECDKLSKEALDLHWEKGIKPVLDKLGPLAPKVLNNLLVDSYEVGANNWTPNKRAEFKKRTGYDLLYYLPALTGAVIENAQITERFLWDFRHVNTQMFEDNYFGHFAQKCKQYGLLASIEPYHGPFECLAIGADYDIQMGEFWVPGKEISQDSPSKIAATSAHTHGQTIVGAESFTSMPGPGRWQNYPASLKTLGDQAFCMGINRFIFHRFAHQPWLNRCPGMTMGQWGTHFDRTNTWFLKSTPWIKYITRCQYLLQQGRFVADALFFAGESIPSDLVTSQQLKDSGYEYDVIGTDLIQKLSVKDGLITLPSGIQYKVLIMPNKAFMTFPLAQKIEQLLNAGATISCPKPEHSPSLTDYPKNDTKLTKTISRLWGSDTQPLNKSIGKGRLLTGLTPLQLLNKLNITPDFINLTSTKTSFIHRKTADTDIYFISAMNTNPITAKYSFRITGKTPEIWNPETATIEPAPIWQTQDNRTTVTINLPPTGSAFIIFRNPIKTTKQNYTNITAQAETTSPIAPKLSAIDNTLTVANKGTYTLQRSTGKTTTINVTTLPTPITLTGPWKLNFDPNWCTPESITLPKLISWTDHEIDDIRYYSGTAEYTKEFNLPETFFTKDQNIILDLGKVLYLAEITLNGTPLATLWKQPFRLDITDFAKPGKNKIQIAVTNLWPNRLIGDEQYPDDCQWKEDGAIKALPNWLLKDTPRPQQKRKTFTTWKHWKKDDQLIPSGLLGPAKITPTKTIPIKN